MPRSARKVSKTGIYHVMLRGINKQDIFEDETGYGSLSEFLKLEKELLERGTVPSFHISGG